MGYQPIPDPNALVSCMDCGTVFNTYAVPRCPTCHLEEEVEEGVRSITTTIMEKMKELADLMYSEPKEEDDEL